MLRLLRIDYLKLKHYRPFWVLSILYAFLVISVPLVMMQFLQWLKVKGADFDGFDPLKIPLLFFPDVWQNVTYFYTLPVLLIFLGIVTIISISNEFSYKTVRQNVIDGMDRRDFIVSKMGTILVLSVASTVIVFLTCLFAGLIYSPELEWKYIIDGSEFVFAYFLYVLLYLELAFLLTIVLRRSALTIFLLMLYRPVELILVGLANYYDVDFITDFLPLQAANQMIDVPFPRYWFQEITDYMPIIPTLTVIAYIILFVYLIDLRLKRSDI